MIALRLIILAAVIALGTVLLGWWAVPLVGGAYGVLARRSRLPGTTAALAGAVAWGGYLAIVLLGGAPVAEFAGRFAASLQLPAWSPIVATLTYPALLAGLASYLGARMGGRYLSSP